MTKQRQLLVDTYGAEGQQILDDAQAYADGINAYWAANGINQPPATVNDVIAVHRLHRLDLRGGRRRRGGQRRAPLQAAGFARPRRGPRRRGKTSCSPTTPRRRRPPTKRFDYGPLTGGPVTGSVAIDAGSIQSIDPQAAARRGRRRPGSHSRPRTGSWSRTSARPRATRWASWARSSATSTRRSSSRSTSTAPGINAQGAAVPGLAMYILIGRTQDYAWSLTSAGHDVRDVFAERLCEPDGSAPTRASDHYLYRGSAVRSRTSTPAC